MHGRILLRLSLGGEVGGPSGPALPACEEAGADHRSLPERLRAAVFSAGSRRGLALRTKQCYGAWAARYGHFSGDEREVMKVETASRFLASVVNDEDCAY
jgi:hypothetical protein